MYHTLKLQNGCNIIKPQNMICFRYAIVNTMHGDKIIITIIIIIIIAESTLNSLLVLR